ncbi:hypothetical protein [Methylacidimicrobium cyclopophantes]|uniref:hypothetical protein n=1 Tax=Methylacidimicrobium cyclopophantes TaxID=1041766 RepID=UPI00115B31D4|nr:hypothetical protein [Methylacidimicrobium cyclopophantes]
MGNYISYLRKLLMLWLDPSAKKLLLLAHSLPADLMEQIAKLSYPSAGKEWREALFRLYQSQNPGPNPVAGWGGNFGFQTDSELLREDIEKDLARTLPSLTMRLRKLEQEGTLVRVNGRLRWKDRPPQLEELGENFLLPGAEDYIWHVLGEKPRP